MRHGSLGFTMQVCHCLQAQTAALSRRHTFQEPLIQETQRLNTVEMADAARKHLHLMRTTVCLEATVSMQIAALQRTLDDRVASLGCHHPC